MLEQRTHRDGRTAHRTGPVFHAAVLPGAGVQPRRAIAHGHDPGHGGAPGGVADHAIADVDSRAFQPGHVGLGPDADHHEVCRKYAAVGQAHVSHAVVVRVEALNVDPAQQFHAGLLVQPCHHGTHFGAERSTQRGGRLLQHGDLQAQGVRRGRNLRANESGPQNHQPPTAFHEGSQFAGVLEGAQGQHVVQARELRQLPCGGAGGDDQEIRVDRAAVLERDLASEGVERDGAHAEQPFGVELLPVDFQRQVRRLELAAEEFFGERRAVVGAFRIITNDDQAAGESLAAGGSGCGEAGERGTDNHEGFHGGPLSNSWSGTRNGTRGSPETQVPHDAHYATHFVMRLSVRRVTQGCQGVWSIRYTLFTSQLFPKSQADFLLTQPLDTPRNRLGECCVLRYELRPSRFCSPRVRGPSSRTQ